MDPDALVAALSARLDQAEDATQRQIGIVHDAMLGTVAALKDEARQTVASATAAAKTARRQATIAWGVLVALMIVNLVVEVLL